MARSLEELEAIQKEHEERMEEERRRKEAEEKAERERRERALNAFNKRNALCKELIIAQKELDAIESTNIQERIKNSEEIKEIIIEKEEELNRDKSDFVDIEKKIAAIKKLIEGKKYIAPEINEELTELDQEHKTYSEKIKVLSIELENLKSKLVTDKEIENYENIVEKVYSLENEIKNIENDPDVGELIAEEVKEKSDMIKMIIDACHQKSFSKEKRLTSSEYEEFLHIRNTYIKNIAEQFIKDEIESRQIEIIRDRDKRIEAYRKISKFIILGLNNQDPKSVKFDKDSAKIERSLFYAGLALANLIGKYNNKNGIIDCLGHEISEEEKSSKVEKIHKEYGLKIHFKTLNILHAFKSEIGDKCFADIIMGYAKNFDINEIKNEYSEFSIEKFGAIFPKKAPFSEQNEAKKIFEESKIIAKEAKDKIEEFEQKRKIDEIEKLNSQLLTFKNILENMETLENNLKGPKPTDLNKEEQKIKEIIAKKEARLQEAKKEYDNTLLLNISKRGDLSKEIKDLEDFIASLKADLEEINLKRNNWTKNSENLHALQKDYGGKEELKSKIVKIEEQIKKVSESI